MELAIVYQVAMYPIETFGSKAYFGAKFKEIFPSFLLYLGVGHGRSKHVVMLIL